MTERSEANNRVVFASPSPHCPQSGLLCNSKALRRIASVLAAYAEDKCAPTVMAACEAGLTVAQKINLPAAGRLLRWEENRRSSNS